LTAELTVRDGKIVYDLNGMANPEWTTLPANYGPTGDRRWDAYAPARARRPSGSGR
jgi:hypothetical protein